MRIHEIMSDEVQVIAADATAGEAAQQMRVQGIHHLVVTGAKGPIAVISERDLRGTTGAEPLSEVMSSDVIVVSPETTVKDAANKMRGRSIGCLPVVSGKKLVGIVTVSDMLDYIGRAGAPPSHLTPSKPLRKTHNGRAHRV